jgi:hypothetical protein
MSHVLWITDDNFFADRDWAVSVLQAIIASGIKYNYTIQARFEVGFDDEMLDLMKKAGFVELAMGIEFIEDEAFERYHKKSTRSEIIRAIKNIQRHGLRVRGLFILGADNHARDVFTVFDYSKPAGRNTRARDDMAERLAHAGANLLMMEAGREDGIYHAREDAWQKDWGFNDFYDGVFNFFTDMERVKLPFSANGKELILWGWKGDYINLGAGAELGIYKDTETVDLGVANVEIDLGGHYFGDTGYSLPMKLNLDHINGKNIFRYAPPRPQWWITGFNPEYLNMPKLFQKFGISTVAQLLDILGIEASEDEIEQMEKQYLNNTFSKYDLLATAEVNFSSMPELWEGFYERYRRNNPDNGEVRLYPHAKKVVIKW